MTVYAFYIFDRHGKLTYPHRLSVVAMALIWPLILAECIYKRRWQGRPTSITSKSSLPASQLQQANNAGGASRSADDDAKLIFGTVFSLRNMARKLGGEDDRYDHRYSR